MTAVNVVRKQFEMHVFSDGMVTDPATGKVHFIAPKIALLPHMQAVLVGRGPMALALALASNLIGIGSFDEAVTRIPDQSRKLMDIIRPLAGADPTAKDGEVHFCGWSERDREFHHYMMPTDDRYGADHPAFDIKLHSEAVTAAPLSDEVAAAFTCPSPGDFHPVKHGIPLMELQRANFPGIGGFVQHVVIGEHWITTGIIHRWPDKPGDHCGR